MHTWVADTMHRYYLASPAEECETLTLEAARGERVSFQMLFRTGDDDRKIEATITAPTGLNVQVRRIGYVPMPHLNTDTPLDDVEGAAYLPGYVPDPLFPETTIHAGRFETHAFWVTITVPVALDPGVYAIGVTLSVEGGEPKGHEVTVNVHRAQLPPRRDFPVTHWFYPDTLINWYGIEPWSEECWRIFAHYFTDLVVHGQDTLYVSIFTPPLDGVKRPTQLLHITRDGERYLFDWTMVRRWIDMARAQGITHFEWTHLFTQWGAEHAIRIYEGYGESAILCWPPETGATSATYRQFLAQFLPEFKRFLDEEGLLECSFFHVSDEPHGEAQVANYTAARALLRELAPWMRVMDALTDIVFARNGLTDLPVPSILTAVQFVQK